MGHSTLVHWTRLLFVLFTAILVGAHGRAQAGLLQSQTGSCTYTVAAGGPGFIDISPEANAGGATAFPAKVGGMLTDAKFPELDELGVVLPFGLPMPGVTATDFQIQSNGMIVEYGQIRQPLIDWTECGAFPFTGLPSVGGPAVSCPPPYVALAPWWGDLSVCQSRNASVTYRMPANGSADPAIFQWTNVSDDDHCIGRPGVNTYTFQIQLYPDGTVYYVYGSGGTQTGSNQECGLLNKPCTFAIGAESGDQYTGDTTNGIGIACNPDCGATDFPAGQTIALQLNPQIYLTDFTVGGNASVDGTVTVDLQAQNAGPPNADTEIAFYYSQLQADCVNVPPGLQMLGSLGPVGGGSFIGCSPESQEVRGEIQLSRTAGIVASSGYLIAAALVNGMPTNPACFPLVVGPAQPDFTCDGQLGGVPSAPMAPGTNLSLNFNLVNLGATATGPAYGYFISQTPTPTQFDLQLGANFDYPAVLEQGGEPQNVSNRIVPLPTTVPPGVYTVGVILNPHNTVAERSTTNNLCVSATPLTVVCDGPPMVTRDALPQGYTQVEYRANLSAVCGDGNYSWALGPAQMANFPPGLSLAQNGTISGVPTTAATYVFDVTVTDRQSPPQTGMATLSLTVNSYAIPLAIVTTDLPSGSVAHPYSAFLSATGGMRPYRWCGPGNMCPWSATGTLNSLQGTLPVGVLISEDGTVKGVPTSGGPYQFQVAVQDSSDPPVTKTSGFFVVDIGEPGQIAITTSSLPLATVGKYYQTSIAAEGGKMPYGWSVLGVQRLPTGPGDPGTTLGAALPVGFTLDPISGNLTGTPEVSGSYALQLRATDSSVPPENSVNSVFLTILPANGLQILNSYLPQGTIHTPYSVQLDTNAIDPVSVVFTAVDSAGNPSNALLPAGIGVTRAGQIQGTPQRGGSTDFLVQAQDNQNRVVVQALRLTVEPAAKKGGCASAPGEASGFPVYILLGLVACRARRRRPHAPVGSPGCR